jgi:hypothetical protein
MMTWDIFETREKILKKISAPTISREGSKKNFAPTIVDPISKKIISGTLFLAHQVHKLQQRTRWHEGHIVHPKKIHFMAAQHFKHCSEAVADAKALAPCRKSYKHIIPFWNIMPTYKGILYKHKNRRQ